MVQKNCFKSYVNLIPLNKIQGHLMSEHIISHNQSLAQKYNGHAQLALHLIDYDKRLENTMRFVFGNTMIVSSSQIGHAIANQTEIAARRRCVTLEGDVYDTSGSL